MFDIHRITPRGTVAAAAKSRLGHPTQIAVFVPIGGSRAMRLDLTPQLVADLITVMQKALADAISEAEPPVADCDPIVLP